MNGPRFVGALRRRGMRVWSENGRVIVEPDALTEADLATILAYKPAILAYLRSEWTADIAYDEFTALLAHINDRYERSNATVRARIEQAVWEHEGTIDAFFERHDYESLRYCLTDLELSVRDVTSGPRLATRRPPKTKITASYPGVRARYGQRQRGSTKKESSANERARWRRHDGQAGLDSGANPEDCKNAGRVAPNRR